MKLNDEKLSTFKYDVGHLLNRIMKIQKDTSEVCIETQKLMEEFLEIIDQNED